MSADRKAPEAFSLRRWSQRKLAVAREERSADARSDAVRERPASSHDDASAHDAARAVAQRESVAATDVSREARTEPTAPALPSAESLTFESDFTAFMQPGVDESVRRTALRKLLRDPRFNVMDGLDVYIDDYSKPDPIAPEIVRELAHARYLFDPPKTRINDEGYVEDVVESAAPVIDEARETAAPDGPQAGATEVPALDDARATAPTIDVTRAGTNGELDTQATKEATDDERA